MTGKSARDQFTSRLGMLAATLGSAVGLGNIWKFPALTGENGGASFLLIYLLATMMVGLPVMIAELAIGRATKGNAIAAFRTLCPGTLWWIIGALGLISCSLVLSFYSEVGGWVFAYVFKCLEGSVITTDSALALANFQSMTSSPWQSLFWQYALLFGIGLVIMRGASKGIEKVTRLLMPILFFLLVVVCIRSLTLPNAMEGLRFLFMPDFSKVDGSVVLMALGLAFFKLSVGMGIMVTYGSYFQEDASIPLIATRVVFCDLLVSILAGIAIFPAVFSFNFEPTSGAGLLFLTIPAVFASMPGGYLFAAIFFILTAVATVGAILSLMEVPVAWFAESTGKSRISATLWVLAFFVVLGTPAALSGSVLQSFTIMGKTFFDLYDFLSSNVLMPVGSILLCVFVSYAWGKKAFNHAVSNKGSLINGRIVNLLFVLCSSLTPLLILVVLLRGLKIL